MQRVRTLQVGRIKDMNTLRALVFLIYILGLCFVLSGLILQLGVGLTDLSRCKAAIYLCLVFYVGGKVSFDPWTARSTSSVPSMR